MPLKGEYEPSPWAFAADHVRAIEESGGTEGTTLMEVPVIVLHTLGRKTGKLRKSPLMRVEHDGSYLAVGSMGGAPKHPVWYLNLLEHPEVAVQDGAELCDLRARVLEGDERAEWWKRATEVWPAYDDYQARTERVIPVVLLEPAG
jgi:F420H(2)-dependent quinone reductase